MDRPRTHNRIEPARVLTALTLAAVALTGAWGCGGGVPSCHPGSAGCTSVLFLGNSYTYVNDLPSTFAGLADSGGHAIATRMVANGGETLADHASASESLDAIDSEPWTFVVLQEQSETPATDYGRAEMAAAAKRLDDRATAAGARALLFLTAAHRDGLPDAGLPDYESMQRAIDDGYLSVASRLGMPVVPAGYAWFATRQAHPDIALWQADGSHPEMAGTYLEACVFYAAIFREGSTGLGYTAGLPEDEARTLQAEADATVLPSLHQWGLDFVR